MMLNKQTYIINILLVLTLLGSGLMADEEKAPVRPTVSIDAHYKGKLYKDLKCKILAFDDKNSLVSIVTSSGKAIIVKLEKDSIETVKKSIDAFAESRTKLEKEKAEAEKERLELFNKYIKFNALGESYETCVKRFGNPSGIKSIEEHENKFYAPMTFYSGAFRIRMVFINKKCEWVRFSKKGFTLQDHNKLSEKQVQMLFAANVKEKLYSSDKPIWINKDNTFTANVGDFHVIFYTALWKEHSIKMAAMKLRKEYEDIKALAEQGDLEKQYKLHDLYIRGIGVDKDLKKGKSWLIKSAENGYIRAQVTLAFCYQDGAFGFQRNLDKAKEWYKKAADQGDKSAQEALNRLK